MSDEETGALCIAAQHARVPDRTALSFATTDGTKFNTIRDPLIPVACWRLNHPAFAFDSSFVSPTFRGELATLSGVVSANSACPAALFGHCDPAGSDDLNKTLGDRRAIAIYALLTRQPALWEYLYSHTQVGDTWDTRMVQCMLSNLPDGNGNPYYMGSVVGQCGPQTTDAVKRFQGDNDLSVDGDPGRKTRDKLFLAYMDWLCTPDGGAPFSMQASDFLGGDGAQLGDLPKMSLQSCGKFNPIVLLASEEMNGSDRATRNADDAPNRRVLMFFFAKGTTVGASVWPCPKVKESNAACTAAFWPDGDARRKNGSELREYKTTRDTMACRFYDRFARRSPCEGSPAPTTLVLWFLDELRKPMPVGTPYRASVGGRTHEGTLPQPGFVVIPDVPVGATIQASWADFKDPKFVAPVPGTRDKSAGLLLAAFPSDPTTAPPQPPPAKDRSSIYVPVSRAQMKVEAEALIDPATVEAISPSWHQDGLDFVDDASDGHFLARKLVGLHATLHPGGPSNTWDTRLFFVHPLDVRYFPVVEIPAAAPAQTYFYSSEATVVSVASQSPETMNQMLRNLQFADLEEFKSEIGESDDATAMQALRDLHANPGQGRG